MKVVIKTRNLVAMIILMTAMIVFAGCGNPANEVQDPYKEIISKYAEVVEDKENIDEYYEDESLNVELLSAMQWGEDWKIYWAVKDIDNNGVDELLISGGSDTEDTVNYEIYTIDNSEAVKLFPEYSFGYRTNFIVYEDNIIYVSASGGAYDVLREYYKVKGNVTSAELIESVSTVSEYGWDSDEPIISFYHDEEEVTEADYNKIIAEYEAAKKMEFEWQDISEWTDEEKTEETNEENDNAEQQAPLEFFGENNLVGKSMAEIEDKVGDLEAISPEDGGTWSGGQWFRTNTNIVVAFDLTKINGGTYEYGDRIMDKSIICTGASGTPDSIFGMSKAADMEDIENAVDLVLEESMMEEGAYMGMFTCDDVGYIIVIRPYAEPINGYNCSLDIMRQ